MTKKCKYIPLYLTFLIPLVPSFAKVLGPPQSSASVTDYSAIVMNTFQEKAGWATDLTPIPEPAIEPVPGPLPTPTPVATKEVTPSQGQKHIQDVLRKNRQTLSGNTAVPAKGTGAAAIAEQLKKNRAAIASKHAQEKEEKIQEEQKSAANSGNLKAQYLANLSKLKSQSNRTLNDWKTQNQQTLNRWREAQKKFLENLPEYKKNTFKVESFSPPSLQSAYTESGIKKKLLKPKNLSQVKLENFKVLPGALDIPVRDQGKRPTCAAFAGIRAIEVLLAGHGEMTDLSEQYFYWASKPQCRQNPCASKGSWVLPGYRFSMEANSPDIPTEEQCPYQESTKNNNETQIPLAQACTGRGKVKIEGFYPIASLGDILDSLNKNQPIVGGFKLSPNFYQNEGLIKYTDRYLGGKTDTHAAGHALLIVGYMKLPTELHTQEGDLCLIVANSWGEGWGAGGHACLTRKWFDEYKIENAFMTIEKVRL